MDSFELLMKDISIEFPGVKALKDAKFDSKGGVVHALIGANGAGKSTMMKVLSGAYSHWTGQIYINGEEVNIRSVKDSKSYGIEIVYQEVDVALIPNLSVAENIMLDEMVMHTNKKQFVNWKYIFERASDILKQLNVKISVKKNVENISLAEKQMVLIARAISKDCKLLILDEPTAPLSNTETEELFRVIRELKAHGVGIIYISHRLPEIFAICDEVTVMRDGAFIIKKNIADTTEKDIVEYMLGRSFEENYPKYPVEIGDVSFEVKDLSDNIMLKNISLHVKKGEIIGLAGLVGAGKTELCKAIFGANPIKSGELMLNGNKITVNSPHEAVKHGLAFVPEERRKEGVLVEEPVYSNLTLPSLESFARKSFMNFMKEFRVSKEIIHDLNIKTPSEFQKVAYLSGGNQQKIVVGKWLIADADIYIFDEPTKGVDVGAKKDIFELIGKLAKREKSIIYASCELPEILGITDRVYVMYNGGIVKELATNATTEDEILFYSAGGNK